MPVDFIGFTVLFGRVWIVSGIMQRNAPFVVCVRKGWIFLDRRLKCGERILVSAESSQAACFEPKVFRRRCRAHSDSPVFGLGLILLAKCPERVANRDTNRCILSVHRDN